jgi:hypothetical protein
MKANGQQWLALAIALFCIAAQTQIVAAAADALGMPRELVDYAHSQGCAPVQDFYERAGMVNPPYVYGFVGGEPEDSDAFWCRKAEKSDKPYLLLLKVSDPKKLDGCPDRIEWWNYPKGLSVETRSGLKLSDFHFAADPKRPGPTTIANARVIVSEYDGVEEIFVCHQGVWLFMLRD